MAEGPLAPLPSGKLKLHAEHFRKVVRRIECIKPLAGDGVKIKQTEDGIQISSTSGGLSDVFGALPVSLIELTVCRNGEPAVIYVAGYDESENVAPEPD